LNKRLEKLNRIDRITQKLLSIIVKRTGTEIKNNTKTSAVGGAIVIIIHRRPYKFPPKTHTGTISICLCGPDIGSRTERYAAAAVFKH